jgi:hypothetical protein
VTSGTSADNGWAASLTFDAAAFQFGREQERVAFDVENWGEISVNF